MTVAELEQGLRDLAGQLYAADITHERQKRFRERLRLARRTRSVGMEGRT
jgi:hypothetical protein